VTAAGSTFGQAEVPHSAGASAGKEAIAQYDYEKAEDNELELRDGERITNIEMVDEDWWMGQNSRGEVGLFPANYVELVPESGAGGAQAPAPAPVPAQREPSPPPAPAAAKGQSAIAQYDYEATEDNELSFPDGAKITDVVSSTDSCLRDGGDTDCFQEFPDDDWWLGSYGGNRGLFPANYVELER
jgi:hypothetical protein